MARMLTQVPLPLLPGDAAEIAPGVGMVTGPDGCGVMWVHGLAAFAWDAGDEAGRRCTPAAAEGRDPGAGGGGVRGDPGERVAVGRRWLPAGSRAWSRTARARGGPRS